MRVRVRVCEAGGGDGRRWRHVWVSKGTYPGMFDMLSPTAAMMEQSSMTDTLLTMPCFSS